MLLEQAAICAKCAEQKPVAAFYRDKSKRDGRSSYCIDCHKAAGRKRRQANPELDRAKSRAYQAANREAVLARRAQWRAENRELHTARACRWKAANRERVNKAARERRQRDPVFALQRRVSRRVRELLGGRKNARTESLVGWTAAELSAHLERQFVKGMSWENMGEWHIDHIVPLSSFTITGPDDPEFRRAWALTNLRPLWARENCRKGGRVEFLL